MKDFTVLAVGDIVGQRAVSHACAHFAALKKQYGADLLIVNAENAADGNGLDRSSAEELLCAGADVLTTGNHVWQKRELASFLDACPSLLRPANYRAELPGRGWGIYSVAGVRVLVMNLMGTVFLDPLACPFETADAILEKAKGQYDIAVADIHAEATSEKLALGYYLDGRVQVIFGTHTHVQTADEQILPAGSGYITDLGMTGPALSVLGVRTDCVIRRLTTHTPVRFETAGGQIVLHGACFRIDLTTRRVTSVQRCAE